MMNISPEDFMKDNATSIIKHTTKNGLDNTVKFGKDVKDVAKKNKKDQEIDVDNLEINDKTTSKDFIFGGEHGDQIIKNIENAREELGTADEIVNDITKQVETTGVEVDTKDVSQNLSDVATVLSDEKKDEISPKEAKKQLEDIVGSESDNKEDKKDEENKEDKKDEENKDKKDEKDEKGVNGDKDNLDKNGSDDKQKNEPVEVTPEQQKKIEATKEFKKVEQTLQKDAEQAVPSEHKKDIMSDILTKQDFIEKVKEKFNIDVTKSKPFMDMNVTHVGYVMAKYVNSKELVEDDKPKEDEYVLEFYTNIKKFIKKDFKNARIFKFKRTYKKASDKNPNMLCVFYGINFDISSLFKQDNPNKSTNNEEKNNAQNNKDAKENNSEQVKKESMKVKNANNNTINEAQRLDEFISAFMLGKILYTSKNAIVDGVGRFWISKKEDKNIIAEITFYINKQKYSIRFNKDDLQWHITKLDDRKVQVDERIINKVLTSDVGIEFREEVLNRWNKIFREKNTKGRTMFNLFMDSLRRDDKKKIDKKYIEVLSDIDNRYDEIVKAFNDVEKNNDNKITEKGNNEEDGE